MKSMIKILAAVAVLAGTLVVAAEDPQVGDTVERVHELMGEPAGYLKSGDMQLLIFRRGRIEIREGVVISAHLVSEEEAAKKEQERERLRAERARLREARLRERRVLAEQLHLSMLRDEGLAARSTREQLTVWRDFQKRYPEVDVTETISELAAAYENELREREVELRLVEMERRVEEAEQRARRAEEDVRYSRRVYYREPSYYYVPVTHRHVPRRQCQTEPSPKPKAPVFTAIPFSVNTTSTAFSPAQNITYRGHGSLGIADWGGSTGGIRFRFND